VAIAKESCSFSGDHGMMPPVSLPFGPQTLFKMSFQPLVAPDTSIKLIAATATDVLIIASS
jgi:hypothetical protein